MKVSVIIPCYNEANRIEPTLSRTESYLKKKKHDFRIICVNDGSKDDTSEVIKKHENSRVNLVSYKDNKGKGHAVKTGALYSMKKYPENHILFMDADLSTPIEMLERINIKKNTIFVGDRDHPKSRLPKPQGMLRKDILGYAFKAIVRNILGLEKRDTQCGFKFFPKDTSHVFKKQTVDGFAFDIELLYIAKKNGIKIKSIPIIWRNNEESKVNVFSDPPKMMRDVIMIKIKGLGGRYD